MKIISNSPDHYCSQVPVERQEAFNKLRKTIQDNLPKGFEEEMSYGMIGYVVPFQLFPNGYHCNPKLPLPFINIASQKNFLALYHMGLYMNKDLYNWFTENYQKHSKYKLDIGKSCIRFKKLDDIPFDLIGQLIQKISCQGWIELYENQLNANKKA